MNVYFFVAFSINVFFSQALCSFMYRTGDTDRHFRLKVKVNDFSQNQTRVTVSHVVYVVSALAARATNPASCMEHTGLPLKALYALPLTMMSGSGSSREWSAISSLSMES